MSGTAREARAYGDVTSAISDGMAGLLSRYTGRGATSSWTTFGKDLIVCVMEDALTKGERNLVQFGRTDAVMNIRSAFQEGMAQEAISLVEDLSGRHVTAFMSNNSIDPDLAVEIFVLQRTSDGRE